FIGADEVRHAVGSQIERTPAAARGGPVRPIYVTNDERASRLDDALVKSAMIVATSLALAVALVAIGNAVVFTLFAAAGAAACVVWALRANEVRRDVRLPLDA